MLKYALPLVLFFVPPSNANKLKKAHRLFGCGECQRNVPLDGDPRLGDVVDISDGQVLFNGDACFPDLDSFARRDPWAAWQGKRQTSSAAVAGANILNVLLPVAQIEAAGKSRISYSLTDPVHESYPASQGWSHMSDECTLLLLKHWCKHESWDGLGFVTSVYAAAGMELELDSQADIQVEARWNSGEVGVQGKLNVEQTTERAIHVTPSDGASPLVIGYLVKRPENQGWSEQKLREQCSRMGYGES